MSSFAGRRLREHLALYNNADEASECANYIDRYCANSVNYKFERFIHIYAHKLPTSMWVRVEIVEQMNAQCSMEINEWIIFPSWMIN